MSFTFTIERPNADSREVFQRIRAIIE